MELSGRLFAVANLVEKDTVIADVGTDHGYVPIYLIEQNVVPRAIAMDVNEGPLERAILHIEEHQLQDKIETKISDGVQNLEVGEVDAVICAGMGGQLIINILTEGKDVVSNLKYMILQPQSEIDKVRRFLVENGFNIVVEDMVEEEGKYYPMMKVVYGHSEAYEEYEYLYGKCLLQEKHPVMLKYLKREKHNKMSIITQLSMLQGASTVDERILELGKEMTLIKNALECYK